jgi:hypothetical protein
VTILRPGEPDPIFARSGWRIPRTSPQEVLLLAPVMSAKLMQIHAQEMTEWKRYLTVRSESLYPYNCVGMIFASRRAWIEIDHVYDVLREDGYRQVSLDQATEGDVVLYKRNGNPTHVGLIIMIDRGLGTPSVKIMSKWGRDPEFIHFIDQVPSIFGVPSEYYTERV